MFKKYLTTIISCLLISFVFLSSIQSVKAQSYTTTSGSITGSGVCALYPDSCKTDQHRTIGSNWSSTDMQFTQNHDHYGWLGALQAENSSYSGGSNGTKMTNAVYYVSVKDVVNIKGSTGYLVANDINLIIGDNTNDKSYKTSTYNISYSATQIKEGDNYVFGYTLFPSSTAIGANTNNIYTALLYSDVGYNSSYYSSISDIYQDIQNKNSNNSKVQRKTPGSIEGFASVYTFTDTLPTLYYNPTYDIFEGLSIVEHPSYFSTSIAGSGTVYFDVHREIYVRALFIRGGSNNAWISGLNSSGSLYNPNTGLGRTLHGVVNQLDFYPSLFTSDQYEFIDGGNGETIKVSDGKWVQPNTANPSIGRIITNKYPSPLYGTHSLAMKLREYDSYYKGGKDILNHHANSLILYMNVNQTNLEHNNSEFDSYIIFYKDGDYVDLSKDDGKLIIQEKLIINGSNIDMFTQHNGTGPITSVNYYDVFGGKLPYELESIELLPHSFAVYNDQGLPETYWNVYEAAFNGNTKDNNSYLNIYCAVIGFNYIGLDSSYNAKDGYTMLDIFWPNASMSESAGCESVSIDNYGLGIDGGPNVNGYVNTTQGNSIYGNESYNQLDGSSLSEFASTITNLDITIDSYAKTMKDYINQYTSFLQSDYPLLEKPGFLSTAASMKTWIDGLLAIPYLSPFIDTVLLIVIVMIAIR